MRWLVLHAWPLAIVGLAAAQPRVEVGTPAPRWVEQVERPASVEAFEGDIEELLHDEQWRVETGRAIQFERTAYRVRAVSGVQRASELAVRVEAGETLEWHHVLRHRDGRTEQILDAAHVRVIQPETALGGGIYDESRRALVFLEDIRVGDVIEHAYTVTHDASVLGGRFAARFPLGLGERLRRLHVSVRWPHGRRIHARVHPASLPLRVEEGPGHIVVDATDLADSEIADHVPSWHPLLPSIELTELETWEQIVAWALPLYRSEEASLEGVPVDRFREAASLAEQALLALRFVQDEVRYLGLEVEEHALVPHAPAVVARRRYGDCKDKALLLVTILRALGVEAYPALVNTFLRQAIDDRLPSPFAFNHVVVRVTLDGAEHWLDPTLSHQRGPLSEQPPLDHRRALVIRAGETAPIEIPMALPDEPELDVIERYDVRTLDVETTYRGREANARREDLDSTPREDLQLDYLDFYVRRGLEVAVRAPIEIEDDEIANVVRVLEHYTLANADDNVDVSAWSVIEQLPLPAASRGSAPFALAYPLDVRHFIELRSSVPWSPASIDRTIEGPGFTLVHAEHTLAHLSTHELRLRTSADHVPADAVAEYAARAREARNSAFLWTGEAPSDEAAPRAAPERSDPAGTMVACGGLLGVVAMFFVVSRVTRPWWHERRKRQFRRAQRFEAGESPETAIGVRDAQEAERKLGAWRCCEAEVDAGAWTKVRFGGVSVLLNTRLCKKCGEARRRYYRAEQA